MNWAVLLMAYGGPDSLDDVEPYLLDVRGGRATSPALVAEIRERYARIGGCSPLLGITRAQASALETFLNAKQGGNDSFRVFVGMRHWHPYIHETVEEIHAEGFDRIIALCMTPFASKMSTGAYREKLNSAIQSAAGGGIQVQLVESWYDNPRFIQALKELVQAGLEKFPDETRSSVPVLFTAHSLPAAIMQQGDPYAEQFQQAAALTAQAAGLTDRTWKLGYQSAGASNMRWLGPSLQELLHEIAAEGATHALVAPIGFVCDHVEILYDIDIEAKEVSKQLGIHLERIEAPNTFSPFIEALADVVLSVVSEKPQSARKP